MSTPVISTEKTNVKTIPPVVTQSEEDYAAEAEDMPKPPRAQRKPSVPSPLNPTGDKGSAAARPLPVRSRPPSKSATEADVQPVVAHGEKSVFQGVDVLEFMRSTNFMVKELVEQTKAERRSLKAQMDRMAETIKRQEKKIDTLVLSVNVLGTAIGRVESSLAAERAKSAAKQAEKPEPAPAIHIATPAAGPSRAPTPPEVPAVVTVSAPKRGPSPQRRGRRAPAGA
nr:MAG: ORF1 protein [Armillaria cepistipes negative-stranded RNA virus 1]